MDDVKPVNEYGMNVSHLMVSFPDGDQRRSAVAELAGVVDKFRSNGMQIVVGASFGHESDAIIMIFGETPEAVLSCEQSIKATGAFVVDSFFSLTESSEYTTTEGEERTRVDALDIPDDEKIASMDTWRERMEHYRENKLFPKIPARKYMCFYPMSKKREAHANWFALSFEERVAYMRAHGTVGRKYAGRILQLITGSTGLTDWEWGVTLFSDSLSDIKDIVYEMRFDEASALYGEFGHFTIARICEPSDIFAD